MENESQTREDKHFTFAKSGTILKMNQEESERLRYFFIPFVYSDKEDPWRKYKMPGVDRLKEA